MVQRALLIFFSLFFLSFAQAKDDYVFLSLEEKMIQLEEIFLRLENSAESSFSVKHRVLSLLLKKNQIIEEIKDKLIKELFIEKISKQDPKYLEQLTGIHHLLLSLNHCKEEVSLSAMQTAKKDFFTLQSLIFSLGEEEKKGKRHFHSRVRKPKDGP